MKTAGNDSRALYMVYMFMGQEQCVNILAGDTQLAQRILYALAAVKALRCIMVFQPFSQYYSPSDA